MELELRPWQSGDAADLAAALCDKEVLNNLRDGLPYPYTEEDGAAYISAMRGADPDSTFARAIVVDGRVRGSIGAFRQGNIHARSAELGYYLARPLWGRGIMSEAIRRFCGELFADTDLLRIFAEPFTYNTGSRRALEKAGFRYEGTLERCAVKNGKVLDMALYALTRPPEGLYLKRLSAEELEGAKALIRAVFLDRVAPGCSGEGVRTFLESLSDRERDRRLRYYGAYEGRTLAGVLAAGGDGHISYFFVAPSHRGRGMGRLLLDGMKADFAPVCSFTVHAAPGAEGAYRRLGFFPTGEEREENGIRFLPMIWDPSKEVSL